ncbi:MAG: DNA polymerase III subunit gamma/tau [Bacteroidota bacterium]|nr:DNA polymerase III subunit gamma/tau [Bacteroidota bacterium]
MEQFIVSARKYRPKAFESVVGQSHITETLLKSVDSNHLAQALLFCGPRGVGKTTCARILAHVINSDIGLNEEQLALNIFELDAASNNSVDDIRRLIDQVRFAPQTGKFKVYIIDEVHMLSQQAFNAFLKTLEEPPAHAIFILATTEKHKIIPTILSRCQIFDFKRITIDDIAGHLAFIADKEGVKAEPEALHMISEKADGALRDALSLFDRMVSYTGNELTYNQVVEVLDILDYNFYFKSIDLAQTVNYPDLLLLYNEVLEKGFNGHEFVVGMAKHFRDLLVAREPKTVELLEVGPQIKQRYLNQSSATSTRFLLHGLKVFNELDGQYKASSQPRILVELGLLKLVEFISQEKKKSQPGIDNSDKGTNQFLPDALPKRKQISEEATLVDPKLSSQTTESRKSTEVNQHIAVSDADLPEKKKLPEKSAVASPPEGSPTVAFDLPTESRRKRKSSKTKSGLSIASVMKDLERQENAPAESSSERENSLPKKEEGPQRVFTEHELKTALEEYSNQRHIKTAIRSMLRAQIPKIIDKNTLEITVENNTQQGYFNDEQKELVPWLRKKLDNFALRFEVKMSENVQTKKLYMPEEKFKHMAEKNPHLLYLREKLNTNLE